MPIGTSYYSSTGHAASSGLGGGATVAQRVILNVPVTIRSLSMVSYNDSSYSFMPVIFTDTGTEVARGTSSVINLSSGYVECPITATLAANTYYRIGFTTQNSGYVQTANQPGAGHTHTTTDGKIIVTTYLAYSGGSGSVPTFPTTEYSTYELQMAMSFDNPNKAPNAPTGVSVTNSPVPTGTSPNVSWTFSDPDVGNTQGAYQIRWRKKD